MKKKLLTVIGIAMAISGYGQNYPFPMNEQGYTYPYGISATTPSNETVQQKFVNWDNNMYVGSTDGTMGRIRYDDATYTVSEGIGYGMLIYVYMANSTNTDCQEKFDKLYDYYKRWSKGDGLMNWKIQGFDKVASDGTGAATDADLDVAFALCLAAKQWGTSSKYVYADEAEDMMTAIYNYEVATKNSLKVFKPGDVWDTYGNSCYFTMASVGVFKQAQNKLGFSNIKDWTTVYNDGFTYLDKCQRNGLWPNWSNWDGSPASRSSDSQDFGWDACRVPWRIGWDYVWYGTASGKTMLDKTKELLVAKSASTNPSNAGYFSNLGATSYSGVTLSQYGGNVAWTGSLACAYMTDATYQSNLDTYFNSLKSTTGGVYYPQTLQVLYMILLSGNAANFYDIDNTPPVIVAPVVSSATSNGSTLTLELSKNMQSSTDYSGFTIYQNGTAQSSVISAMSVSGRTITLSLSNMTIKASDLLAFSYNGTNLKSDQDAALGEIVKQSIKNTVSGTGSTMLADCEGNNTANDGNETLLGGGWYGYKDQGIGTDSYDIVLGGANATDSSAHFTYSNITDYGGMGFSITSPEGPYDFSGSTGITFYHKGSAATLEVPCTSTSDYSHHYFNVPAHTDWTLVTVNWTDLQSTVWGAGKDLNFATDNLSSEITKFQWKVTSGSGEFYLDEVKIYGYEIATIDRTALDLAITTANNLYGKATTDSYPESAITTLYNAIDAAATVNNTPTETQENIDAAAVTLNNAITAFNATHYADKTPLARAIDDAQTESGIAVVGTANGNYTQAAKDALDTAIATAQGQYGTVELTNAQMETAITDLEDAVATFKASVIHVVNKTALQDLMTNATNILNTTTAGTAVGQYSEARRIALTDSLSVAQGVYNNPTATQGVVNATISNLRTAYNLYMSSKVTSTAIDEVVTTLQVYPNPCTEYVTVEASEEIAYVSIIAMQGAKTIVEVGANTTTIPVATLQSGVYSMQIVFADGSTKTKRFVKK